MNKKIYTLLYLIGLCISALPGWAQKPFSKNSAQSEKKLSSHLPPTVQGTSGDCDTINYPVNELWTGTTYLVTTGKPDYVNGTNKYLDKQKGNTFDLSASSFTHLLGCYFAFGKANSKTGANLNKKIFFRVYDDNSGVPGTLLATEERTLSQVKADVLASSFTYINFTTPLALPTSKVVHITADISNFKYPNDSIWIAGTLDGEDVPGLAIEQWSDNSWVPFNDQTNGYGIDVTLWVFPIASTSAGGCSALPVSLISFNGERKNNDVSLSWKVSNELNMKGYEIEKAFNNGIFKPLTNITAVNNSKEYTYNVTDKNAFTSSGSAVQYRIKQINADGSFTYSKTISLNGSSNINSILFSNPFNNALKVQFSLATMQTITAKLYDTQGKLVATEKAATYNAGSNTITLTQSTQLKNGLYILKIDAGNEQQIFKVVKQ